LFSDLTILSHNALPKIHLRYTLATNRKEVNPNVDKICAEYCKRLARTARMKEERKKDQKEK
jgi:hypothetical protein